MKYDRRRALARTFGSYLASELPYLAEDTVVIPIPTAPSRIRQRGFDQAKQIASNFAKSRDLGMYPLLYRISPVDLVGKNRHERHKQMERSIGIRKTTALKGKNILLIDDVLTTGSSLEAAARLLRQHGAKHVDGAVVARHLLN